jgi:hypothetical protein
VRGIGCTGEGRERRDPNRTTLKASMREYLMRPAVAELSDRLAEGRSKDRHHELTDGVA